MKHHKDTDQRSELRDIFAAVAMHGFIAKDKTPSGAPDWVAHQAYKQADAMLDQRDAVSHNSNQKETLINE